MDQNATMKERLLDQSNKSDIPTITYVTPKAIIFFISAIAAVVSMFGNWFALDLDLGYVQLDDILGKVNPFTMVEGLGNIQDAIGIFGAFLPKEVMNGLTAMKFFSILLMVLAVAAIGLYAYAALLRIQENDETARFGKMGSLCASMTAIGFVGMVVALLISLDASDYIGDALGMIFTGPCLITLVCSVISAYCAVMDMGFKEDVVIYHDGTIKIDRGPKWKCTCCHRVNLSLLDKCYYCGKQK